MREYTSLDVGSEWRIFFAESHLGASITEQIESFLISGAAPENWVRLKSSENTNVWKFPANNRWFVFKEYLKRGPFDGIKALIRGSRARRAWMNGRTLNQEGLPTPEIVGFGERLSFPFVKRDFLVTEFIPDALGIYTFLNEILTFPLTKEQVTLKRAVIRSFGAFIGRLHAKGFAHGDLRLDNILITGWRGKQYKFFLIDNERNRYFSKGIPDLYRMINLVQLNMLVLPQVTFADRIRFFRAYLTENHELIPVEKEWMRNVFLKTRKRLQKKMPGIWESSR
ncbi:MAG: lipopolysaccharide kinase InaA family protein [Nitrospirota bacterium]